MPCDWWSITRRKQRGAAGLLDVQKSRLRTKGILVREDQPELASRLLDRPLYRGHVANPAELGREPTTGTKGAGHRVGHGVGALRPGVDHLVVLLSLGDESLGVLAAYFAHLFFIRLDGFPAFIHHFEVHTDKWTSGFGFVF